MGLFHTESVALNHLNVEGRIRNMDERPTSLRLEPLRNRDSG
jgi:hypothetical protein